MKEERCFCGEEWNHATQECMGGHAFSEEDKLRMELAHVKMMCELHDHEQRLGQKRIDKLEAALRVIRDDPRSAGALGMVAVAALEEGDA